MAKLKYCYKIIKIKHIPIIAIYKLTNRNTLFATSVTCFKKGTQLSP